MKGYCISLSLQHFTPCRNSRTLLSDSHPCGQGPWFHRITTVPIEWQNVMIKKDKGGRAHKHHTKICAENSPSRSLGSIVKLYMCYAHLAFEQIIYIVHAKKNGKGKHRRCLATGDAPSRQEMHHCSMFIHMFNHNGTYRMTMCHDQKRWRRPSAQASYKNMCWALAIAKPRFDH